MANENWSTRDELAGDKASINRFLNGQRTQRETRGLKAAEAAGNQGEAEARRENLGNLKKGRRNDDKGLGS